MTEQIYIDGTLMDIEAGGGGVQMVFQSPYFTDLKSIVSNRTNSVSLPATANNLRAIGYAGTQAYTQFPYRKHDVIYKRDGIQLLKGTATLLSVQAETITMCFVWGNNNAFSELFDVSLQELAEYGQTTEVYCQYKDYIVGMNTCSMYIKYGMNRSQPVLMVNDILTRITNRFGVSGINVDDWKDYAIPLMTRKGDATTKELQAVRYGTPNTIVANASEMYWTMLKLGNDGSDAKGVIGAVGNINVSNVQKVRVKIKGSFRKTQSSTDVAEHTLALYWDDGNGWDATHGIPIATPQQVSTGVWDYSVDYDQVIDVSAYTQIDLVVCLDVSRYTCVLSQVALEYDYIILDPDESEDVIYGTSLSSYPMFKNLPDMSCGQFLKNLMLMTGRFAYSNKAGQILFTSLIQLYAHRTSAVDWTQKVLTTKGKPMERTTTLDGVCKKNWLKYKSDEGVSEGEYDAYMTCDDDNAESETTLFESDFALAPNNLIPCWQDNDGTAEFVGDSRKPRIVWSRDRTAVRTLYDGRMKWQNIKVASYNEYQRVILHPVVIKVSVLMNTADLQALDLTIPVYLRQTGRYYCIKQLTTKNGTEAEATLIQL